MGVNLMRGLGASLPFGAGPAPRGEVWGSDNINTRYRFTIYDIRAVPSGIDAVYIFARLEGATYVPLYIGRADVLSRRLTGHERKAEAIRRGATFLLVHELGAQPRVPYKEAERRLIAAARTGDE